MGKTTTIVLLVLVIGLGAAVFLIEEDDTSPVITEDLFPGVVKDDVESLSFRVGNRPEINVRRDEPGGESWSVMIGGRPVPAASVEIEEVLAELGRCRVQRRLPAAEVDAGSREEWLLTPAVNEIRFTMRGEERKASFGKEALMRDTVFAERSDSEDVLVVTDGLLDTLVRLQMEDVRARRILDWSVYDVAAIEVSQDGELRFEAARDPEDETIWRASKPFVGYLDPEAMEGKLLPLVLGLEADEFPADDVADDRLGEFGLAPPTFSVTLTGEEDRGTRTILFGKVTEEEPKRIFYMEEGRPFVYAADPGELPAELREDPAQRRDRNISRLGWRPVDHVEVRFGETTFSLRREHGEWHLETPQHALLDQSAVEDWLEGLRKAEAKRFADASDPEALGFAEPRAEVVFRPPADDEESPAVEPVLTLLLGADFEDGEGAWVLRKGEEETAYLADPSFVDLLAKGHYPLKRPDVLDGVELGDRQVIRIVRSFDGQDVDVTTVEGKWPPGVRQAVVSPIVAKLLNLRVVRWVGPAEGRLGEYGLEENLHLSLRVTLVDEDGEQVVHGVDVGAETEGGRFARAYREGDFEPDVFVIESRMSDPVTERPEPDAAPVAVERGLQVPLTDEEAAARGMD